eukprot:2838137-Lingulodinium_polyedra.AAC.1
MGVRKAGPNAVIVADCAAGVKDGLLSLQVKTRNAQGTAPPSDHHRCWRVLRPVQRGGCGRARRQA